LYESDARIPTAAALSHPLICYQVHLDDYKAELVAGLSDAWELARQNIQQAQKQQKCQYDHKFAHPFHRPYWILDLTPTNASVCPSYRPDEAPVFISLDCVQRCPKEIHDQFWLEPVRRKPKIWKKEKHLTENIQAICHFARYKRRRSLVWVSSSKDVRNVAQGDVLAWLMNIIVLFLPIL